MFPKSLIARAICLIAIVIVVLASGLFAYQVSRGKLNNSILAKVDRLVLQIPTGNSELEWSVYVYWTHNLHCETMSLNSVSHSSMRELNQFLNDAIERGPDRETIRELWDRYSMINDSGYRYRTKYEPVRDKIIDTIAQEGSDYVDVRCYQNFLQSVRTWQTKRNSRQ